MRQTISGRRCNRRHTVSGHLSRQPPPLAGEAMAGDPAGYSHVTGVFVMSIAEGFFVDWDGNARSTLDPGGGYFCETDTAARYVAISTKSGALVHEGTLYKTLADIEKAGIRAPLVPGSHPWGRKEDGF